MAIEIIYAGMFGAMGGTLRAIVGLVKSLKDNKKVNIPYFLLTSLFGILIGIVTGILLNFFDWRLPFVAGYAGTDVLEGLVKVFGSGKAYGLITK